METMHFKKDDVEVTFTSVEQSDGLFNVEINAIGDKAKVEEFIKALVEGTSGIDVPIELTMGKADGTRVPVKVSDFTGDN